MANLAESTNPPPTQELHDEPILTDAQDRPETPLEKPTTHDGHPLSPVQSRIHAPPSLPREILFVSVLCLAQLMTQAGLALAIVPIHIIGKGFGTTQLGQLSWFAAAYSLTVGTFILIAGRMGDIYGHKKFFVMGYAWYALWSLVAGFSAYSGSQVFFDVCRALQGIGPAFLLPNSIAILGRTYPPGRRKEMIFSCYGATAPSGFLLGAVFSSLLAERVWWPWAYWIMGIACCVGAVAGLLIIPQTPRPEFDDSYTMFQRLDVWGSVTGVVGLVLINFAWNQGPVVGWQTPYTYALLIVGFFFIAVFAVIEHRVTFPLLPMDALSRDTAFVLGCVAAGWASFGIWVYYLWQLLEVSRGISPLLGSAMFVPTAISGCCAALTTGVVLSRIHASLVMGIAMLAFTIGGISLATAPVDQTYWAQTFVSLIVMPWGMDMSFPAATLLLSNTMHKDHQGVAASLVTTVINYSISIGLGLAGTIEAQVNDGGANLLKGYRGAWYMGIGLSGLGIIISALFALSSFLRSKGRDSEEATLS